MVGKKRNTEKSQKICSKCGKGELYTKPIMDTEGSAMNLSARVIEKCSNLSCDYEKNLPLQNPRIEIK